MKNNLKRVVKYTMLSIKLIFKEGKTKAAIYVIALFLPPIINIFKTIIYAKLINSISVLSHSNDIFNPLYLFSIFILISAGQNIFGKIQDRCFWILSESADEQMMLNMMNRTALIKQISFDSATKFNKVKDSIGSDLSLWNLNSNLFDLITTITSIIGTSLIIKNYNSSLIGMAFLFSIPSFLIRFALRKYDAKSEIIFRRRGFIMEYYTSLLTGVKAAKEIRIFGIEDSVLKDWSRNIREFQKQDEQIDLCKRSLSIIIIIIEALYIGFITWVCAKSVVNGLISIGQFYLYTSNLSLLFISLNEISETIRSTLNLSYEYDMFQEFTKETEAGERVGSKFTPSDNIAIRFQNVSFSYDDKPVLQNISFEWKTGETIALIGRNGSGKSTLIKLICGLYECDNGAIYINDVDIKKYSQCEIYKLFGIVYQNFIRYQLPLRHIIASQRLINVNDDDALWAAFEHAGCKEFKKQLTHGLDTMLGREYEDGIELSGGQWQKLAIARNYFGNRPFMIFDEPASALDPEAEHKLIQNVLLGLNVIDRKSVLVISHRLSIGKLVDRIIYLEDGRIIEQGKHDELMERGGSYAKMFNIQASLYESEESVT